MCQSSCLVCHHQHPGSFCVFPLHRFGWVFAKRRCSCRIRCTCRTSLHLHCGFWGFQFAPYSHFLPWIIFLPDKLTPNSFPWKCILAEAPMDALKVLHLGTGFMDGRLPGTLDQAQASCDPIRGRYSTARSPNPINNRCFSRKQLQGQHFLWKILTRNHIVRVRLSLVTLQGCVRETVPWGVISVVHEHRWVWMHRPGTKFFN